MPDASKVRWSKLKVGIVGLAAFVILFVLVFLLTSSKGLFQHYATLRTYMDDASGLPSGAAVRLNGITAGYLDRLELTNSRDLKRRVAFFMKVKTSYLAQIPVDSPVGVAAANLLGDKFLNITKGVQAQHVQDGGELPALPTQDIPEMLAQMGNVLTSLQTIVTRADGLLAGVEAGHGNLGLFLKDEELYRRFNAIAAEGQQLLIDVRTGHGTVSRLLNEDGLYNDIDAPLKRIDAMIADLQSGQGTAGKILKDPALFDDAHQTLQEIRKLVADLNAGKGTAGHLLKDDQLSKELESLVAKFNTTVDRINSGQGTIGQLMVNPQLYDSLNGATREFQSLAKDIRANPKKFLTIRLTLF
jgi:phospholipid/cholesterol/gamma-HCH transport system substrate-binding protein